MTVIERPIPLYVHEVRAILAGRQTQLRRALKVQPIDIIPMNVPNEWATLRTRDPNHGDVIRCRFGVPGDRLWVRETWGAVSPHEDPAPLAECNIEYRADLPAGSTDQPGQWSAEDAHGDPQAPHWLPSTTMPRSACRIVLEVAGVRVERVQAISHADVLAEGGPFGYSATSDEDFAKLWDSVNSKRAPWSSNPWVWALVIKRVTVPPSDGERI